MSGGGTHSALMRALADEERAWMSDGACVGMDPELWFPARGEPTDAAKRVCRSCPVRETCLEYALSTRQRFGIWGGLSERERRRVRREARRERAA